MSFLSRLLVFILLASPAAAATLPERLAGLAAQPERELHYEETRESALLKRPVTYRGRLAWDPDSGHLTKWVDEPRTARLTITPTHLEAATGTGRIRRMPLERRPELAALLGGIRALLAGDAAALEDTFDTDYREDGEGAWLLRLAPRAADLAARLSLLEIRGKGNHVSLIDTLLGGGEHQRMRMVPQDHDAPPTPLDDAP